MLIAQDYYYVFSAISFVGFWCSAYIFIHTGRKCRQHKTSTALISLFTFTTLLGILGVGGDLPRIIESHFSLWMIAGITLYSAIKSIDLWGNVTERSANIHKERAFRHLEKKKKRLD